MKTSSLIVATICMMALIIAIKQYQGFWLSPIQWLCLTPGVMVIGAGWMKLALLKMLSSR